MCQIYKAKKLLVDFVVIFSNDIKNKFGKKNQ